MSIKIAVCNDHIGDSGISDVTAEGTLCFCGAEAFVCVDPYDVADPEPGSGAYTSPCEACGVADMAWDHMTGVCDECARWEAMCGA